MRVDFAPINFNNKQVFKNQNHKKDFKHNFNSTFLPAFYGSTFVVDDVAELKKDVQQFPNDINYRKNLLINTGKNPNEYYKLRPIIGSDEIKTIMKEFNKFPEVYSVGYNDSNIKNKEIRANLHIHTTASDGYLTIQELLDKASDYANEVVKTHPDYKKAPFTIAITDHDEIKSTKDAIEIISQNPNKYKNLRVILGSEISTFDNISKTLDKPTNSHVLVYGIDPNEKVFKQFIDGTKAEKQQIQSMMVERANKTYKHFYPNAEDLFSVSDAKNFSNILNKNLLGTYNIVEKYVEAKYIINDVVLKNEKILKEMKKSDMPNEIKLFMEQYNQYQYIQNHKNHAGSVTEVLPKFLSTKIKMSENEISEILKKNLEEKENVLKNLKESLLEFKTTKTPKYKYMPTMETLYDSLKKQPNAIIGLAHPLKETKKIVNINDKISFLNELFRKFVSSCREKATFSEVYYQSYKDQLADFSDSFVIKLLLDDFSKSHNLFKTGSADTHRTNIFKRYF